MPSFIVVTPHLTHLAPLAAQNVGAGIQPVFIANGICEGDRDWLTARCPTVPVVRFRTSFTRNRASLLEHGEVIDALATATPAAFCIQDADCFVTDPAFWDEVGVDLERDYAAGPFVRKTAGRHFPETFFLCLNGRLLGHYRQRYGLSAACAVELEGRTGRALAEAGYPRGVVLETRKPYYDTLQQFWVLAEHSGYRFRQMDGEGTAIHHIGGTSYLHRSFEDVEHWDYWPLNVHYFHLRLLETPACDRFRDRFAALVDAYRTSGALLAAYPDYAGGWRREQTDQILNAMLAGAHYHSG